MTELTWEDRERPILEAAVRLEGSRDELSAERFVSETSIEIDKVVLGLGALIDAGYLIADVDIHTGGGSRYIIIERPTEKARRATGQWPSTNPYEDLVAVLDQRIAAVDDAETKGKLRKLRDGVIDVGKSLTTDVLAKVLEHQMGL